MKDTFKRFIKDETGSELIQFAIVIAIVAALAVVAIRISDSAGNKMEQAADLIDNIDIPNSSQGGGGGAGGAGGGAGGAGGGLTP